LMAMILVSIAMSLLGRKSSAHVGAARRLAPLAACALAAGVFVIAFPNPLFSIGASVALQVRLGMARVSLAMLAAHPWFGVGIGRYYEASGALLASSSLATYYFKENAHNNFLQIAAELGLVGFAAVGWLFCTVGLRLWRAAQRTDDPLYSWFAAALVAFLLTALVGHPLLTPEVSLNFWLLLGIAAGSSTGSSRFAPRIAASVCVLLLATFPTRLRNEIRDMDREHVAYGLGPRSQEQNGIAFRTIQGRATFFLRSDAAAVRIPLRARAVNNGGRAEAVVAIELDGRVVNRVTVEDDWKTTTLVIPKPPPDGSFHKVVLVAVTQAREPAEIRVGALEITYQQPR
jgi:O-antigen ligase/polysaccharide polymerase Wzy-like membrane protein